MFSNGFYKDKFKPIRNEAGEIGYEKLSRKHFPNKFQPIRIEDDEIWLSQSNNIMYKFPSIYKAESKIKLFQNKFSSLFSETINYLKRENLGFNKFNDRILRKGEPNG